MTTATTSESGEKTATRNPFETSLVIELHTEKWGITEGVSLEVAKAKSVVTDKADNSLIRLNRKLITCPEYDAIVTEDSRIRAKLRGMSVLAPTRGGKRGRRRSLIRSGAYLIPFELVQKADDAIESYKKRREELIAKFVPDAYERAVAEAKETNPLFDPRSLPSWKEVRNHFYVEVEYSTIGVPDAVKRINATMWRRKQKELDARISDMLEEARTALRESIRETFASVVEKFAPAKKGERRVLREGVIEALDEKLANFKALNLAGDEELARIVEEMKALRGGIDLVSAKKDEKERGAFFDAAKPLLDQLDVLVQEAPARRISWGDD